MNRFFTPLTIVLIRSVGIILLNSLAVNLGAFAQSVTPNGYTITGRITSSEQNSFVARIAVTNTQTGQTVFTDERGVYTFTGLKAGRVYIYPLSKNVRFSPVVQMVTVGEAEGTANTSANSYGAAKAVTKAGVRASVAEFQSVEATYAIQGRVTAQHNRSQGVPNVIIATDNGRFAMTDNNGFYEISGVQYGTTTTLIPQVQPERNTIVELESLPARRTVKTFKTVSRQNFIVNTTGIPKLPTVARIIFHTGTPHYDYAAAEQGQNVPEVLTMRTVSTTHSVITSIQD
jgi:hypothetical protein